MALMEQMIVAESILMLMLILKIRVIQDLNLFKFLHLDKVDLEHQLEEAQEMLLN